MALVWIMIPGVGFFYSGLLRRKNALSMIYTSLAPVAVVSFQWFFWGYSLTLSDTGGPFIGNLSVLEQPSVGNPRIPAILFSVYQLMFAAIIPAPSLAIGAIAERGRFGSLLVFVFVWSTIVYDPITCWTWGPSGWSAVLGSLDFAGGTPVHINSGTVALAISLYLGRRRGYGTKRLGYKPFKKNTSYIILGTVLLWFGWFGFNGDSTFGTNLRAIQACIQVVMNMAALVGV